METIDFVILQAKNDEIDKSTFKPINNWADKMIAVTTPFSIFFQGAITPTISDFILLLIIIQKQVFREHVNFVRTNELIVETRHALSLRAVM